MDKVLKRIACIIGLVLLIVVFALNVAYTAKMEDNEKVIITENTVLYLLESVLIAIIIYNVCKIVKIKSDKSQENNTDIQIATTRKD